MRIKNRFALSRGFGHLGTEWPIGIIGTKINDMRNREMTGQVVRSVFFEFPMIHSACPLNFV